MLRIPRRLDRALAALSRQATQLFTRIVPWRLLTARPRDDGAWRILFVRSPAIGDTLVALGALRALAEEHPRSRVDIVGGGAVAEACEGLPYVGEVISVDRRRRWAYFRAAAGVWRRGPYDIAIDGYSGETRMGLSRALILAASRARTRIGPTLPEQGRALTTAVALRRDGQHMVDASFELLAPVLARSDGDRNARFVLREAERRWAEDQWAAAPGQAPRVLLNIAVGHVERAWPIDHYRAVLSRLRALRPGARLIVLGQGRQAHAGALASEFQAGAPDTTFRQMMSLVASADLVISPDTAIIHVAAAFDRTVLSIHPRGKECWRPYGARGRAIFAPTAFAALKPEPVVAALDEILGTEPDLDPR